MYRFQELGLFYTGKKRDSVSIHHVLWSMVKCAMSFKKTGGNDGRLSHFLLHSWSGGDGGECTGEMTDKVFWRMEVGKKCVIFSGAGNTTRTVRLPPCASSCVERKDERRQVKFIFHIVK